MKAFVNGDIYTNQGVLSDHALLIEQGLVKSIVPRKKAPRLAEHVDVEGRSIAPGFVDLQVNGGGGILFNAQFDKHSVEHAARAHQRTGTTSIFPTVFTATFDAMQGLFETVTDLRNAGFKGIAGIHYEGPVINADKAGVHDPVNILPLDERLISFYERSAKMLPTLVTLAPEQIDLSVVARLRRAGVSVLAGHTNASYDVMCGALRAGMQGATHMFNAMSALTSREPGVVGAILSERDAYASIILDGHHLHWASFRVAYQAMEASRLFFVTDAMPCVGSDLREFKLGELQVFVRDGRCVTQDGTLAGSALTMAQAVKNAVQKAGVPRPEALRMASAYPAKFVGLDQVGVLEAGRAADFVVFTNEIDVGEVYVAGEKIAQ